MKSTKHICPICTYPYLQEAPRSTSGGASYEICPSCGFQFGVSDDDDGIPYDEWRDQWIAEGMIWSSKGIPQPKNWKAPTPPASSAKKVPVKKTPVKKVPAKKAVVKKTPAKKAAPPPK